MGTELIPFEFKPKLDAYGDENLYGCGRRAAVFGLLLRSGSGNEPGGVVIPLSAAIVVMWCARRVHHDTLKGEASRRSRGADVSVLFYLVGVPE